MRSDTRDVDDALRGAWVGEDCGHEVFDHVKPSKVIRACCDFYLIGVDLVWLGRHGGIGAKEAGVVYKEVEVAVEVFLDGFCESDGRLLICVVGGDANDSDVGVSGGCFAGFLGLLDGGRFACGEDETCCSCFGEDFGCRSSDASTRSSNDGSEGRRERELGWLDVGWNLAGLLWTARNEGRARPGW